MNRRQFLLAGAAAGVTLATPALSLQARRRPNIIYILSDDLGYGHLGSYGQELIRTPHLDRMAAEGVRFTAYYAGSSVCAPSRCTLMTGMHTGHARVRGNFSRDGERIPLSPQDVTVGELLQSAGYTTGIVGKWGLGEPGSTGVPNRKGFDYFYGFLNQRAAHTHYPGTIWRNDERIELEGNAADGRNGRQYVHDSFTHEALHFVRAHRAQPFFLYLAYTIPHGEFVVPDDSLEAYAGKFSETPNSYQETPLAAYAAMVTRMDRDVWRLLALLADLGLERDTLVLFSSDNGPTAASAALFSKHSGFRGFKSDLYEGGLRCPMIARWPDTIRAGVITDRPTAMWDFLPTAAEVADIAPPANIDGVSFLPLLLGQPQRDHDALYWELPLKTTHQAARLGRWKGLRQAPNDPLELYDLEADPGENLDVANDHPTTAAQIESYLAAEHSPSEHWPLQQRTLWLRLRDLAKEARDLVLGSDETSVLK